MRLQDAIQLTWNAVLAQGHRSLLTAIGIAVGIGAVVLLTSIGEGIHRFVLAEFTQFGTNLIGVAPGKTNTLGVSGAIISNVRPLSLEDAEALGRLPEIAAIVPVLQGNAEVEAGGRRRRGTIIGAGPAVPQVWRMEVALGEFLPADDLGSARAFAVLGSKMRAELFPNTNPLGQRVRIGSEGYRVIGVMAPKGQMLGFDLDDTLYIPAARALAMFNRTSLMEIDLLYRAGVVAERLTERIKSSLIARHGREDFTITTQQQMLDVLGSVLGILTLAVGALGGISLFVGAVGILTIMTIAVTERTAEIGLLRALGAERAQILLLFLGEAVLLAAVGGIGGLGLGVGGAWVLGLTLPALPVQISWDYLLAAEALAALIGLLAGVLPARHAAGLDPLEALRVE